MRYPLHSPVTRYGAAIVCVAISGVLSYAIPSLKDQSPTPLFIAAVLLTTWWAGPGPGLLATGASAFLLDYLFLEPLYSAISNPDDLIRLLVFIAVCTLITLLDASRRRAEEGLRRSESRFRRLSDSRLLGVHRATRGGSLIDANDAFLEMIGCTRDDLHSGTVHLDAMTPANFVDADARSFIEIESRGVCTPYEKEYVRRDGSRVPVLTGAARLEDTPNEDICFTLDLSAMKRAERALRESEERLHQAQKLEAIGKLAGGIAHNFNNLLTVIIGRCDLLLHGVEEGVVRRSDAETILVAANRAAHLTRQLLAYNRRQTLQPVAHDLPSEPGADSMFTLFPPRIVGTGDGGGSEEAKASQGSETLLVVENEPGLLQLVGEVLREAGYTVLEAANGAEALSLCQRYARHIHLVLTDIAMPGMSGTQLTARLASIRPSTRLLAMSGFLERPGGTPGSSLPFIAKPFTPDAIRRKVREVLDGEEC